MDVLYQPISDGRWFFPTSSTPVLPQSRATFTGPPPVFTHLMFWFSSSRLFSLSSLCISSLCLLLSESSCSSERSSTSRSWNRAQRMGQELTQGRKFTLHGKYFETRYNWGSSKCKWRGKECYVLRKISWIAILYSCDIIKNSLPAILPIILLQLVIIVFLLLT